MTPHKIKAGKLYDFGHYGQLYVAAVNGRNLWVTDVRRERKNRNCLGWGMDAKACKKRVRKADALVPIMPLKTQPQ